MNELENIISEISNGNFEAIFETVTNFLSTLSPVYTIIGALICVFLAFFSYKLFKLFVFLGGAAAGFFIGSTFIAGLLSSSLDFEYLNIICGVACALIFGGLALPLYKLFIFLGGAGIGFLITSSVVSLLFANQEGGNETVVLIISAVGAIAFGIIFLKLFKPLYIVFTAIPYSLSAVLSLATWILGISPIALIISIIGGLVLGVFAAKKQFAMNSNGKAPSSSKKTNDAINAHRN